MNKPAREANLWYNEGKILVGGAMLATSSTAITRKVIPVMEPIVPPHAQKRCPKCGEVKPASAFKSKPQAKSGLASYCKSCMSLYIATRGEEQFPEGHKRCSSCREIKPFDQFFHSKNTRDGYGSECKPCHKERQQTLIPSLDVTPRASRTYTRRPKETLPENHKRCLRCNEVKPFDAFPRQKTSKDGLYSYCRACGNDRSKQQVVLPESKQCSKCGETKPAEAFYIKRGRQTVTLASQCRECCQTDALTRQSLQTYSYLKSRRTFLRHWYNISLEEYDAMLEAQGGVCASCQQPETTVMRGKVLPLAVDHDRETGRVRGLLCRGCNMALGLLLEDPQRIEGLLRYTIAIKQVEERNTL